MSHEKTILEIFEETEKENRKVCEKAESENAGKARAEERKLLDIRAQLENQNIILAGMMIDYRRIEGELQTAAAAEISAKSATAEKVKAGEVSVGEFLKVGMNAQAIRKQAAAETKAKLADVAKLIREKRVEIYRLKEEEATTNKNLTYLIQASPRLRLEKLKEEVESFQRSLNPVAEALMAARNVEEKAQIDFRLAQGKRGIDNLIWDDLSFAQIAALRFDPRIEENLIPEIEKFLFTADSNARFRGRYITIIGEAGGNHFIAFDEIGGPRIVDRSGKITTADLP